MAEKWPGITVRCTTNEQGDVPRSVSSQSPDIIVSGKDPLEDPSILTEEANYGNAYQNSLYIGLPNYLYVRGKNFTDAALEGHWTLYWATPNILLYPYLWEDNPLATSGGNQKPPFSIEAGKIGASEDAFTWVPADTQDHYCMIGIAETPDHGNPLAGVTNITDLGKILSENANIAQRNLQLVRGSIPQLVSKAGYNQGGEPATVDLAVIFDYLPLNSSYTVSSGTPLDGKTLKYSGTNPDDHSFKYAWRNLDIPAQWQTMFNYTVTFGNDWSGIPEGKKPTVTIRGELVQEEGDPLYYLGREAEPDPETGEPRIGARGGPVRIVTVGEVATMAPDVGP